MQILKKVIGYFKVFNEASKPKKMDWLLLGIVSFVFFISYIYADLFYTTRHGINLWTTIMDGRFFNYYSYNAGVVSSPLYPATGPMYPFLTYAVFAVWNFPLWILEHFFKVDVFTSAWCMLWMKAILLPFLYISAYYIYKICRHLELKENYSKWAAFIFLTSGLVFSSIFIMTQYDVLYIPFMLMGLLAYLRKNYKKFILFFAIAIAFKLFAFMAFIPMLLLIEKKVLKIIMKIALALSVIVIVKIPFMFDKVTDGTASSLIIEKITNNQLPFGLSSVCIYVSAFIGICIFCYVKIINDEIEYQKYSIYIPFLAFSAFFLLTNSYPYWFVLLTPFATLVYVQNEKHIKINLLLDALMSSSMIILQQIVYFWCYGLLVIQPMFLPKIFGKVENMVTPLSINQVYEKLAINFLTPQILNSVYFAAFISILVINFPRKTKNDINQIIIDEEEPVLERSVIWFRFIVVAAVCSLPILTYLRSVLEYGLK